MADPTLTARSALAELWDAAQLPAQALGFVDLPGHEPALPSSFPVATVAQASLAAAALAAAEVGHLRDGGQARQRVSVDLVHAALDCCAWFTLDGQAPVIWDKLSGLYRCGGAANPGWVRIHANFAHHRDGALRVLGLPPGPDTERNQVTEALKAWDAVDFETAAVAAGVVCTAVRSFDEWDRLPQASTLAGKLPISIERIDGSDHHAPLSWPSLAAQARPLDGLRVLDLTRILAGPVAGRTLAAYGADVMLVNSPNLPNIESIADTSRGKRSVHVDLKTESGRDTLRMLASQANVFMQGYRPGALAGLDFGPDAVARLRPGIVYLTLSAYGHEGPWAARRGYDSLVQTANGYNVAEAEAFSADAPKALPIQVLDYTAGFLLAFGASVALHRQATLGGSWHVRVSLAGVATWLRRFGRTLEGITVQRPPFEPYRMESDSGFGRLMSLRHPAVFSRTPAGWSRPSVPPGTDAPVW
ncbi:CoA transferase [soil metagenome]